MKVFLSLLLVSFSAILVACGGDDSNDIPAATNSLSVDKKSVTVPAGGGTATVVVTSSREWGSYTSDAWLTVSPDGALTSPVTVTIKAEANSTSAARQGTVTIMSGAAYETITVEQAAGEGGGSSQYDAPEGYQLVWNDEFDKGLALSSEWTHEVQGAGWVNNELQTYVNKVSPNGNPVTELENGLLKIHCFKEGGKIYSGRVYAKVNQGWTYGYFEARIKLPKGKGTWPAFWMMPVGNDWKTNPWPMCGEIDIMEEVGCVPNEVSSSLHTQDYNHTKNTQKTHAMRIADAEGAFHVYALEWTPDAITTYVDGKVQLAVTKADLGSGHNQWPFHYAFYPILNLAWGGSWGGMYGVDESALPVTMEVDYVRVVQK